MTLPVYLVALFWVLDAVGGSSGLTMAERLRAAFWRNWRPVVSFFIPVVAAGLVALWWNWARYGSIFDTGYVSTKSFTGDLLAGLYGLTVGPARGLIWYNPVLLLAIPGAIIFWHNHRRIFVFCLLLTGLYVVVYAKWYMWHGGYRLGPTIPGTDRALCQPHSRGRLGYAGHEAALGVAWSGAGSFVDGVVGGDPVAGVGSAVFTGAGLAGGECTPAVCAQTFTELRYSPLDCSGSS